MEIQSVPEGEEGLNSFALVAYIPGPLGRFIDQLRKAVVPGCDSRAHVTILPPRPLKGPACDAWREMAPKLRELTCFDVGTNGIEVFETTEVVYIGLSEGRPELCGMNREMNQGAFYFDEPFRYHPHITLAQDLPPGQLPAAAELIRTRWAEFAHPRRFPLEVVTFVQNTASNRWIDLAECRLKPPPGYSNNSI